MTIGTSLFLIAAGAILRYAVTASVSGIDLQTVGLILMIVGIIGLVLSIAYLIMSSERARGGGEVAPQRDYRRPPRDPYA